MPKPKHSISALRPACVLPLLAACFAAPAMAQQNPVPDMANDSIAAGGARAGIGAGESTDTPPGGENDENAPAKKRMKPDLLIVPIPMSNPTLGAGLTVAGVLFYNPNGSKQPWVSGVGGMYTSNKSWGGAAFHSMSLADDRFKVLAFGGYANINMKFFGVGAAAGKRNISVGLEDRGAMGLLQGQYRIADNLYVGARYQILDITARIKNENPIFPDLNLPEIELRSRISGIGPSITYDSRDNPFAPRKGANVTLVGLFNIKDLGSDFSYDKWQLSASGYLPVTSTGTLAIHGAVCAVSNGGPFYDLCLYGQAGDLRGYETGRYRDRASWATQAEWRQKLNSRFGAVFFAGIGGIAKRLGDLGNSEILPSAGMGLRYRASQETGINLRLDFAMAKDSHAIYFGLGEVF